MLYIRVGKKIIKNQDMFRLHGKLSKKASVANTHGITHLDGPSLYISPEKEILIIQAADTFVKDYHKPALFHANSF